VSSLLRTPFFILWDIYYKKYIMAKKIVRITESDLVNIVKRVLNERGGHDDFIQMAQHGGATLIGLEKITKDISELLNKVIVMSGKKNIPKHIIVSTIAKISKVLEIIKLNLVNIEDEIMGNEKLTNAVSDLRMSVESGRNTLSILGSFTYGFADPEMPGGLTGAGLEMGDNDLINELLDILTDIAAKAVTVKYEADGEYGNIKRRLGKYRDLDDYNLN
jgi:hypothetical protein